jgi:hypothetical protein
MSETPSHKAAKAKAAGRGGQTEVPLHGKRRLDAISADGGRATEIERSGTTAGLKKAARRLKASGANQRILQVPQSDMPKAVEAMKGIPVSGTVKNLGGTKKIQVR